MKELFSSFHNLKKYSYTFFGNFNQFGKTKKKHLLCFLSLKISNCIISSLCMRTRIWEVCLNALVWWSVGGGWEGSLNIAGGLWTLYLQHWGLSEMSFTVLKSLNLDLLKDLQ